MTVAHANGLRTTYLPVAATVAEGQRVRMGEVLGTVSGPDGHCAQTCLHWGLLSGDLYLDPLHLLGLGQVRLLPTKTESLSLQGRAPCRPVRRRSRQSR